MKKARLTPIVAGALVAVSSAASAQIPTVGGSPNLIADVTELLRWRDDMVQLQRNLVEFSAHLYQVCLQQQAALQLFGIQPAVACQTPVVPLAPVIPVIPERSQP
jgi:hypothetical protein